MKNIGVNYGTVETVTAAVASEAAIQLESDINTAYQEMSTLLANSAGEGVDKIKEELAEDQLLAAAAATMYRELADLVKKASDEMEALDNAISATSFTVNG